ncbi:MAG: tetratricopeptide repeat protein [Candidatus Hydrogenedentes bacterium]|nr:tetratricopeptide repeat protein [Candidatus Hydrogenedentota bacterium]
MSAALFSLAVMIGANAFQETWDNANAAYELGNYEAAAQGYEQLIASSVVDAGVFYNLGNAYSRGGHLGAAIANYERALRLDPKLERARENLDQTLRQTEHNLARPLAPEWEQSLLFWHGGLRPAVSRGLAGLAWVAFWLALALRQWRAIRYTRIVAVVLFLLAGLFSLSAWAKYQASDIAVAAAKTVPVRFGASEKETVRYELYEGDRVRVDEEQDGWVRVNTISGERGWAMARDFVRVGPPYEAFQGVARGPNGQDGPTGRTTENN